MDFTKAIEIAKKLFTNIDIISFVSEYGTFIFEKILGLIQEAEKMQEEGELGTGEEKLMFVLYRIRPLLVEADKLDSTQDIPDVVLKIIDIIVDFVNSVVNKK